MASSSDNQHLLHHESSDLSNASTIIGSPTSPNHRRGYHRMTSQGSLDFASRNPFITTTIDDGPTQGLGISGGPMSINRVPVGARSRASLSPPTPSIPSFSPNITYTPSPISPNTPNLSQPFLSPKQTRFDESTPSFGSGLGIMREEEEISRARGVGLDDNENTRDDERISLADDNDGTGLVDGCPARQDIHNSRATWLSISVLILSIYSTVFSGVWLVLAIVQPRYGRTIHSGGKLSPVTASTLFALFAKTIELSFVTVFITFLGQVLTRRSLIKTSRGITIAELSMRNWIVQPGFMITHWQYLQHASLSVLGAITLTAAIAAMFYTTASDSLVSPHLKYGRMENKLMFGLVKTSYANNIYIENACQTPVSKDIDPTYAGSTCLAVQHAGQAYHNSLAYLSIWEGIRQDGSGNSSNLAERPRPLGILYDNTTVKGSWVQTSYSNMTAASDSHHGRIINNVTMSMPHAGVFAAAHDKKNDILQPEELAGVGEYLLRASVVSPTVNVLCVDMAKVELSPLIYAEWPDALTNLSTSFPGQNLSWPGWEQNVTQKFADHPYLNSTSVDDIFEWGEKYGRLPPVFPMLPIDYNSLVNRTVASSDSNYLLIKSQATTNYTLCQIRSWTSPNCSTQYSASGTTGGHLESYCEEDSGKMAYNHSVPDVPVIPVSTDYREVASEWLTALSMNTGITNANASSSRLLSQLVPNFQPWQTKQLDPLQPSLAETLAVMAGSTLLMSSMDATYYHYWNYTSHDLDPGVYQPFNATLASQQYTSGYTAKWQGLFYVVLLLVFVTNVFCLIYLFLKSGLVTDYTEPQNLFALAINSPPSTRLHGACGAGPKGHELNVDWHVGQNEGSNHFFIKEGNGGGSMEMRQRRDRESMRGSLKTVSSYSMLSSSRKAWL